MPRKKAEIVNDLLNTENVATQNHEPHFFSVNYNELDKDLSPDQLKEWTDIYASYRSRTPLTGTVIGTETHQLMLTDPITQKAELGQILCLVVMNYRVKVIIPQTEIWYSTETNLPDYVLERMVGARVDYVITNVDRLGECAVASRRTALGYVRSRFFRDSRRHKPGQIQTCNVLAVGAKRLLVECNGYDISISNRDLSYSVIADLRKKYRPGYELKAKLIKAEPDTNTIEISIREAAPEPFEGAATRHPINSKRQAVVSGTYAGGVFCTLPDDTTCLCRYSPNYFQDEINIGDSVKIVITERNNSRKILYGKLLEKLQD